MEKQSDDHTPDTDLHSFLGRLRSRPFDESTCFLCAVSLEKVEPTSEHVIPRWAQRRYDLWDQTLTLLNRTRIPYRQLTVPCCSECNTYRLQPIEDSVSSAVSRGPEAVRQLGHKTLFLWLGKIIYGILYKELFLLLDRSNSSGIMIATPQLLQQYSHHLMFLQQAREKIEAVDFQPGSVFVFRTQKPEATRLQWDICDNIDTMFIAVRMGEVGVIGILGDGGAQQLEEDNYSEIRDLPLHPIQFRELCAHFCYRAALATRTPKHVTIQDRPHKVFQLPLGGFSLKPLFEDGDPAEYAQFLAFYTGRSFDEVFRPPDKAATWLHDESGEVRYIDFNEYPFFPGNP